MSEDVLVKPPWERVAAWFGPPRDYRLTRSLIFRLLGVVYVFAFLGLIQQGPGLLGSHGLTPVAGYLDRVREHGGSFWLTPSVFWLDASDTSLQLWAWVGLVIAVAVVLGYTNMPMLLVLWAIYGSYERVGQIWFGFGWEIQILETTLLCAALAHPWDPRPLAARPPPRVSIVLMRWLVFRIMLGAGLIKLRGDGCWRELTCLDAHFETQPIPNPLSAWFHGQPHWLHAAGVLFNHFVEIVAPWFVFGPRMFRLVAGLSMIAFQGVLIVSGNLAFLNWLTLVPVLALLDDDFILRCTPGRLRAWLRARMPQLPDTPSALAYRIVIGAFAALVAVKSIPVIENLASSHQIMNGDFDRLQLVNTYGAFGSVGVVRHELSIEGTMDPDPETATWKTYELPCKPGPLDRRPCILGPYHRRLDWLIWFAAMEDDLRDPWLLHLVDKLLDGDPVVRTLLATDPFDGAKPTFVRIRRFVYHLQPLSAETWWTRDSEEMYLAPIAHDSEDLREAMTRFGW
ncbi:MAG: lipase maturation factor family protein [Kofleriaceae bacterium]